MVSLSQDFHNLNIYFSNFRFSKSSTVFFVSIGINKVFFVYSQVLDCTPKKKHLHWSHLEFTAVFFGFSAQGSWACVAETYPTRWSLFLGECVCQCVFL